MSADTHTHIHQLMSYELVYTSIHSSIIFTLVALTHSHGSLFHAFIVRWENTYFLMSNLHHSLASAQLCPRVLLSILYLKNMPLSFYPVCYLKNFNLVTTDSSCLQSCQFTLLYSIFITENSLFSTAKEMWPASYDRRAIWLHQSSTCSTSYTYIPQASMGLKKFDKRCHLTFMIPTMPKLICLVSHDWKRGRWLWRQIPQEKIEFDRAFTSVNWCRLMPRRFYIDCEGFRWWRFNGRFFTGSEGERQSAGFGVVRRDLSSCLRKTSHDAHSTNDRKKARRGEIFVAKIATWIISRFQSRANLSMINKCSGD